MEGFSSLIHVSILKIRHARLTPVQLEPDHRPPDHIPVSTALIPAGFHDMGCSGSGKAHCHWRYDYELVQSEAVSRIMQAVLTWSRALKRGQQRLYVHRGVEADPSPDSTTPSDPIVNGLDEMGRLENVIPAPAHVGHD